MKPQKKCIFCGKTGLSQEHFWSDWLGKFLPTPSSNESTEHLSTFTQIDKLVEPPKIKTRQGSTYTKKIRVVCVDCNNGWMSEIENATKPILEKLTVSQIHIVEPKDLKKLCKWIALKVMVAEHNQREDAVTPFEDRNKFKNNLEIPNNFRIWIAKCGVNGWEGAYWRSSSTVSFSTELPQTGLARNVHFVTFGVGDLLVQTIHTSHQELNLEVNYSNSEGIYSIYPESNNSISWPPAKSLTAQEANNLVQYPDLVLKSRLRGWKSFPKD